MGLLSKFNTQLVKDKSEVLMKACRLTLAQAISGLQSPPSQDPNARITGMNHHA